jgi:hypothetical protein
MLKDVDRGVKEVGRDVKEVGRGVQELKEIQEAHKIGERLTASYLSILLNVHRRRTSKVA